MIHIPKTEFASRIERIRESMKAEGLDVCFVYGDEYRRENLRYVSNYWPIFERGALLLPLTGEPILLAAPEGEEVCREMSAWQDIRLIPDFACVTVPDVIAYPQANYSSFRDVFKELKIRQAVRRIGIVGMDAMSHYVLETLRNSLPDCELLDANSMLFRARLTKSENEVACLKEAARIADAGYRALLKVAAVGRTELQLAAAAHEAAYAEGAENIVFCLVSSGARVGTIIGRATNKVIEDGDMVMAALAVQYEGYIATANFPFVVGTMAPAQRELINQLIEANERALACLKTGAPLAAPVRAVKGYFRELSVDRFDLYPPMHGCGVAEAESPYPDEQSEGTFAAMMTVNTDISLFGHPGGSNRIEEGFVITEDGYEPMSALVRDLCRQWKETGSISIE
ncbi:M24 family metallopeptidase [Cohnella zeiphila]|uniref:Aminopeptidase P family protein n=1 Tax=Cohnella zeiphila TaxID=2761120 RepID=A0A7X0SJ66_9BACL|nr:Xaa-Pro peptidase family protein [Cohnella zeiphila]MBB6730871.1 aminopeptidase P family protein [Cohnella zeiphila]